MNPKCPKCGRNHSIKSGSIQGRQRWKCKVCEFQFTRVTRRGKPLWQKSLVVFLYSEGMSMQVIASLLQIQPSTVLKWVRAYESEYRTAPKEGAAIQIMEIKDFNEQFKQADAKKPKLWIAIDNIPLEKSIGISITHPGS